MLPPDDDLFVRLGQIVSSPVPRETKAAQVAEAIRQHGNYRWVGIYDVGDAEISVIAWSGPAAPNYPRFPVDRGLSGAAVKTRRTVIANDVSKDPRYLSTLDTTGAEMIVPTSDGTRVVGTIDIESERIGRFSEADRKIVEQCADVVRVLWT
ncbi:MAG TPA: GAF domain-containing protein [Gemmatimonadaceae bacterium]|nr:GAF domain-containing protein [Gemmatimonadaceae bacterium]